MPISTEMIVNVASADVAMDMAFSRSVDFWHNGKYTPTIIDGDCIDDVSLPDGGVLHIHGNLSGNISAAGHFEIVITGNVLRGATIIASGFCHVFVGGNFDGSIESSDSTKLWVGSDFSGGLKTGNPSTTLQVCGDLTGHVLPAGSRSLLYITVSGFAANSLLSDIADLGYTQFNGAIASSDVEPGLYPNSGNVKKTPDGNSFSCWSVAKKYAE